MSTPSLEMSMMVLNVSDFLLAKNKMQLHWSILNTYKFEIGEEQYQMRCNGKQGRKVEATHTKLLIELY